ncbi:MAG: hypothetical protein JNL01_06925 [Bdellovibrionales bacterium]|nr:hypothetical protein [Bdellovibrionales bacterium]
MTAKPAPAPTPGFATQNWDQLIRSKTQFAQAKKAFDKVDKIIGAIDRGAHPSEIFGEPSVIASLKQSFGEQDFHQTLQWIRGLATEKFQKLSFTLRQDIDSPRKFEFLYRMLGGWKQFQVFFWISPPNVADWTQLNPSKADAWKTLQLLPAGTLITAYLRTVQGKESAANELLALERCEAAFETVQDRSLVIENQPAPVVQLKTGVAKPLGNGHANGHANGKSNGAAKKPAASLWKATPAAGPTPSGPPVYSLKVTINKMDTFVHAGNAHLILQHIRDYPGSIRMFVLRGEKHPIMLDADSIWGAEVRNGETVVYDFFGPQPGDEFAKELAKKTNKYTQMDKVAHE